MLRIIPGSTPLQRAGFTQLRMLSSKSTSSSHQPSMNPDVPGLSKNIVNVPSAPVGPNASKDKEYKNPEYFCYHTESFGEAEVELAKYRLPAPSNKVPFHR